MSRSNSTLRRRRPWLPTRLAPSPAVPLALLLMVALAACPGKAPQTAPAPIAPPDPVVAPAPEPDELALRLARLTARLEQARQHHHVPGMAIAVVEDDRVIFAEGFGSADLESRREVTPDTLFAVGSTTKAFTSTLVAMMVDEGKLTWDDPIATHVPELQLQPRPRPRPPEEGGNPPTITIRDVLCHRSGFTRMGMLWAGGALSPEEVFAKASNAEPWAPYGQTFLYNNVTYAAAGEAAARVAGTRWAPLLEERLLAPLGMERTNVTVQAAQADPLRATGYRWREVTEEHEAIPMRKLAAIAPAGAINSTVLDMAQWLRLQLGRGTYEGRPLVSAARIAETWSPQIEIGGRELRYGMGWMLGDWQGHRVVEHGGNIDGYAAEVAMLPDDGLAFVLLTNLSVTPLQRESMGIVFESMLGELPPGPDEPGEADAPDLSPYPGQYVANFATFKDARFTVSTEGGKLFVDVPGQTNYELRPPDDQGRWAFALTDAIKVRFDLDDQGRAQVLHMLQGGYDFELPREGHRIPTEITEGEVLTLLGRYHGEKSPLELTVRMHEGHLVVDLGDQAPFVLRKPDTQGRWRFRVKDDLALEFHADERGAIEALTFHQGQTKTRLPRVKSKERPLPTVDTLLARARAEAFERRLQTLGAVELRGKVRLPSSAVEGRFVMVFDGQRRRRVELDFGPHGKSIDTFDGRAAWSISSLAPPTEHKGKYLRQASLSTVFFAGDWSQGFDQAVVTGRQGEGKDERVLVALRAGDLPPIRLHVDPRRGDVRSAKHVQLTEGTGPIPMQTELSDFRRALGLRLPHRIRTQNEHAGATIFEVESVEKVQGDPAPLFARATL